MGFWLEDEGKRVFIIILYEKLPTFCYRCGLVGHGDASCGLRFVASHDGALSGT